MDNQLKKKIALLAKELITDKISYDKFLEVVPERKDRDRDIDNILYLFEHQPAKKGIFGGDYTKEHDEVNREIIELIDKILKETE